MLTLITEILKLVNGWIEHHYDSATEMEQAELRHQIRVMAKYGSTPPNP